MDFLKNNAAVAAPILQTSVCMCIVLSNSSWTFVLAELELLLWIHNSIIYQFKVWQLRISHNAMQAKNNNFPLPSSIGVNTSSPTKERIS